MSSLISDQCFLHVNANPTLELQGILKFLSILRHMAWMSFYKQKWNGMNVDFIKGLVSFILVYRKVNELPQKSLSNIKLFTDSILIFSVIDNVLVSASKAINDLVKIQKLVNEWKMYFNPGIKQIQKITFPVKTNCNISLISHFNEQHAKQTTA